MFASLREERYVIDSDMSVVCEFPDVFSWWYLWLAAGAEVEFTVDLVHGTSLVSVAPYWMSVSELGELKKQLEELL